MTPTEISAELAKLVQTELRMDGPIPEGDLAEHLDSVQRLTLVVAIEDRFKICFDPEDEAAIQTLSDVVQTIQSKLKSSTH